MFFWVITAAIAIVILNFAGQWMVFLKADEPGWKSIIPFYNVYTLYGICWKTKYFWVYLVLSIISKATSDSYSDAGTFVGALSSLALLVVQIISMYRLSKAFGHGVGFTVGLVLIGPVFLMILGLGDSQYDSSYADSYSYA